MTNERRIDRVLLTDADIAGMLGMSRSWVRKERFNRRRGLPHWKAVIGSAQPVTYFMAHAKQTIAPSTKVVCKAGDSALRFV